MENQDLYDKIDAYLLGRLSAAEKANFEQSMSNDAELQATVQEQKDLLTGIDILGKKQLANQINHIAADLDLDAVEIPVYGELSDEEMIKGIQQVGKDNTRVALKTLQNELEEDGFFDDVFATIEETDTTNLPPSSKEAKVRRLFPIKRVLALAASIAFLLMIGWWFNQNTSGINDPMATYFEPQVELFNQNITAQVTELGMGTGDVQEQLKQIQTGINSLKAKDYTTAIEQLSLDNPNFLSSGDRQLLSFSLAQAYMGAERFEEAIPLLEVLSNNENFVQQEDAQWFLLLVYEKIGDREKASILKTKLSNSEKYKDKANSFN